MGKKIKDKYIKKRPKKRGPYKEKPHDPRKPRTAEEMNDKFPGYKEMNRLAKGIMEEDEEDQVKDDEDEEECIASAIPLSWGKIMTDDKSIQESFKRRLDEGKNKNCHPGNPNHDEDGRWTTKGTRGSWSVSNPDNKSDCDWGQLRATGRGGETQWTKTRCGREERDDPSVKAKWKCKDGTLSETNDELAKEVGVDIETLTALKDKVDSILGTHPHFFEDLTELINMIQTTPEPIDEKKKRPMTSRSREDIQKICNRYGFSSWIQFLQRLNAIKKAESGKME